jgi:hypothetical protein
VVTASACNVQESTSPPSFFGVPPPQPRAPSPSPPHLYTPTSTTPGLHDPHPQRRLPRSLFLHRRGRPTPNLTHPPPPSAHSPSLHTYLRPNPPRSPRTHSVPRGISPDPPLAQDPTIRSRCRRVVRGPPIRTLPTRPCRAQPHCGGTPWPGRLGVSPLARIRRDESEAVEFVHVGAGLCGHMGLFMGVTGDTFGRIASASGKWFLLLIPYSPCFILS